jgi:YggT family protein
MIIYLINTLATLITLLVIVYILSTWVFPPYHAFRSALASIVEPMIAPIRRLIPPVGGLDFSPLIFIVLIQVLVMILTGLLQ